MRILAIVAIAAVVVVTLLVDLGHGLLFLGIAQRLPGGDGTAHLLVMGVLSAAVNLGFANARYRGVPVGCRMGQRSGAVSHRWQSACTKPRTRAAVASLAHANLAPGPPRVR